MSHSVGNGMWCSIVREDGLIKSCFLKWEYVRFISNLILIFWIRFRWWDIILIIFFLIYWQLLKLIILQKGGAGLRTFKTSNNMRSWTFMSQFQSVFQNRYTPTCYLWIWLCVSLTDPWLRSVSIQIATWESSGIPQNIWNSIEDLIFF